MRKIGERPKGGIFLKIFIFTFILLTGTVIAVKFLGLEDFFTKAPKTVVNLITDSGLKSDNNRVNILLLGTGGTGHDGPDLTDTMIFASIDKSGDDVVLVSIPRDLWAPNLEAKINSAYAFGREKDNGLGLAKKTISLLFGMPVHYSIRVDFSGFERAVDLVEGIDVNVKNSFEDPFYPIPGKEDELCGLTIETEEIDGQEVEVVKDATGSAIPLTEISDENNPFTCRYETLVFNEGLQTMDGKTALKFVRSRHGTAGEGSDFARSARQQKAILAFREKVISLETFTSPITILDLIKTFGDSIDTDVTEEDIPLFLKLGSKIDPESVRRLVLDAGREESVLEFGLPQDYGGQSVLIPINSSWTDLSEFVQGEIFKLSPKTSLGTTK